MKKYSFLPICLSLCLFLIIRPAFAQSDVSGLIKSGPADATKLTQAYLKPLFIGLGTGLNSGWNNTAHSKNLLRFDLRIGMTAAVVPPTDETFDVTKIGLSNNIRPNDPAQVITPTLAGKSSTRATMTIYDSNNQALETFTMPDGAGLGLIPSPQLQGSIGLSNGVELSLRAMPKVNLGTDYGSIQMLGGGLKIELLPLISGIGDKLFPVDIALAGGFTQFQYHLPLDVKVPAGAIPANPEQVKDLSNQRIEAKFSGFTTEAIISKRFLVFTPFVSLGYQTSKTDAGLKGNYPVITGMTLLGQKTYTSFTDPVNIKQTDLEGFRANIGFQLNLAFFRIYGSYGMSQYNSFSGGIGFGIGK